MHLSETGIINKVVNQLKLDFLCAHYARPGHCRKWSMAALQAIEDIKDKLEVEYTIEAREVDIERGLSHTFVKLVFRIRNSEYTYLLDGTGVAGFKPYFGRERDAPAHLQNSRSDQINLYR